MENILKRKELIIDYIAAGKLPEGLRHSMDFVKDFGNKKTDTYDVVVISCSYNLLDEEIKRGTIEQAAALKERNRLLYAILGLLDSVETNFSMFNPKTMGEA